MEQNIIKTIVKTECPHCKEEIAIAFVSYPPQMSGILIAEDIKVAKTLARDKINDSFLSDEEKKNAVDIINNNNTIFGKEDIEDVVKGFLN